MALRQVTAAPPNEFAGFNLRLHKNLRSFASDIFLHHNRIRARRDRRSRENADSFPRLDLQSAIDPSRLFADDALRFSFRAGPGHDRITIHRGIIEHGQRHPREQIAGRKSLPRFPQRNLPRRKRPDPFKNAPERFVFGNHDFLCSLRPRWLGGLTSIPQPHILAICW